MFQECETLQSTSSKGQLFSTKRPNKLNLPW